MSSRSEDIQSALGSPCGQYFHGESVTHWPSGVADNAATVSGAIFDEMDPDVSDDEKGKKVTRKAYLLVPSGTTLKKSDAWVIESETWQTESIGLISGGLREVFLVMTERSKTESKRKARREF